jgi:hypothetical protein
MGKKYVSTIGEAGDVELVSELLEIATKSEDVMVDLLCGAAEAGHDGVGLQLWAALLKMPGHVRRMDWIIRSVACGGCIRTAAAIDDDPRAWVRFLQSTLEKGHRPFVEWVLAAVILNANAQYIAFAATSGSLELVKWLHAKGYPVGGKAMRNAASSGNVALCKWVLGHGIGPTQRAMEVAVERGHVEVLEWLSALGCSCTSDVLRHAVGTGGVPVVAWCLDHHTHPPDAGDLLALSCKNKQGSDVFEYLADQRGFQSSPTEVMQVVAEPRHWHERACFDAAILVKRYGTPLSSDYLPQSILHEDLDRLRFSLSQGQRPWARWYASLINNADPTLLNEVLLARKVGGRIPEVDQKLIKRALGWDEFHPNAKKVLADHSFFV